MNTPELIVALDRPSLAESLAVLDRLPDAVRYVKVGLELFIAEGPAALRTLQLQRKNIFLDLKLHDIPNTVDRAVTAAAGLGVTLLTVHAGGGRAMLEAAVNALKPIRARGADAPRLIAVTALTSLNSADLEELGIQRSLPDHVLALGELALASGIDGLVCSVHEAALLRKRFGPDPILITPGIRPSYAQGASTVAKEAMADKPEGKPSGDTVADQKRIATPTLAIQAGASFLVVGRPILDAPDPAAAATAILREMEAASN